ncbi:MAG TPA: hypothetical protein VNA25_13765 [Phycisphaerae bacterium]|nr:hypothetical protein [Phycisphaerae bacterium]
MLFPPCDGILHTRHPTSKGTAMPAVSDGRLYLRGLKNLYCIGKK